MLKLLVLIEISQEEFKGMVF